MSFLPLRLLPGADLRRSLEQEAPASLGASAVVVSGVGSLSSVSIRLAGSEQETLMGGPFELVSLSGTLSLNGAHLHMCIASASGQVFGGHDCYGNVIRTTAEVLLVALQDWQLSRAAHPNTGYQELLVKALGGSKGAD